MFSKSNGSSSYMTMKSPEVSIHFASCSSLTLCGTNQEQIFRSPKSSRTMVCTMSLLVPNSSAINLSISRRSCGASICRTLSIISRVLLVDGRPECRFLPFAKAFEPFVNTFSVHGFPPLHLHQHFTHLHCSFSQFVTELYVCMLFHCAVTLPLTLTMFNWPQSVYTAGHMHSPCCMSILPMSLKNHTHACTHAPSCRSDMTPFTELFRYTLYIK